VKFKLKEGWWHYFWSGALFGFFIVFLILFNVFPESVTFRDILLTIIAVVASMFVFLMGCRVKKGAKREVT